MENTEKNDISKKVRVYRATKRLTQKQFGALCGLSQRIVSYIEKEELQKVSEKNLLKVNTILQQNQEESWVTYTY